MKVVVATGNAGKVREMAVLLADTGLELVSLADMDVTLERPEDGDNFTANALIKAREACEKCGLAALADDSGLCVDALDGAPGVYSARFAGGHGDERANNEKLLRLLRGVPTEKRAAHFACAVALVLPGGARLCTEGRCDGIIGEAPIGENGFGYDPLFFVGGRSFAQMTAKEKNAMSHRARALQKLKDALPGFLVS